MSELVPSVRQAEMVEILVALVGFTGVHRAEPQGLDIILDLLPAEHALTAPFRVRITPNGDMTRINA